MDLRDVFKNMPNNFIISFIRTEHQKQKNLPSVSLNPRLDSSGLFYHDLPIDLSLSNQQVSCLKKAEPNYLVEIRIGNFFKN